MGTQETATESESKGPLLGWVGRVRLGSQARTVTDIQEMDSSISTSVKTSIWTAEVGPEPRGTKMSHESPLRRWVADQSKRVQSSDKSCY